MRIMPVSNNNNNNISHRGMLNKLEQTAATVKSIMEGKGRKSISVDLHNALVRLTAWRTFAFTAALFGFGGYTISDKFSDKDSSDLADAVEMVGIDSVKAITDTNNDGSAEVHFVGKDGNEYILDLANKNMLKHTHGFQTVE